MQFFKTLCAVLLLSVSVIAAGPTLVITDSGYQVMSVGAGGKAVLQDVGQVVDLRGDAPDPTPPPPPDTGDSVSQAIDAITRSELPDAGEATAVAASLNLLKKQNISDANLKAAMNATLTFVGATTGSKTRVDSWWAKVQKVQGFTFTQAGLSSALSGILSAHNIDPTVLQSLADSVIEGVESGKSAEEVASAFYADFPNAAFDFTLIITFLMALLKLLTDLGILGG